MLRVRLVSPPDSTERLVERLSAEPGIRDLVVLPGAARRPAGDALQFDLLTRVANPVLRDLRALPFAERDSVVVEQVDAGTRADRPALAMSPRCGSWWTRRSAQAASTRPASSSCWSSPG